MRKLINVNIKDIMDLTITRIEAADEYNMTMEVVNTTRVISYDVEYKEPSMTFPTFFNDEIISKEVEELNEGYSTNAKGRYVKVVGKFSSFAKKEEAVSYRTVYEYAYKGKEISALIKEETPVVSDTQTLVFQEGMTATDESSEFQYALSIGVARYQPEGTNVVITGTCVEFKNRDLVNMHGRKFSVRHFRLAEFAYNVELIGVGLKPLAVGTVISEITGMSIFEARNIVNKLLGEKESSVIAKGISKEKSVDIRDALSKIGAEVEVVKVEGKSMWVKPGMKVAMIVGQEYRVHGVVKRMSVMQPKKVEYEIEGERMIETTEERFLSLQGFMSEEEKAAGEMVFTFLSPARFVKYVPEDITGKTGSLVGDFTFETVKVWNAFLNKNVEVEVKGTRVYNLSDEKFVGQVLSGYIYREVMNPNDYSVNPMSEKTVGEEQVEENVRMYGWKAFMVQVTETRAWNKAELSGMGGGVDDLLTKITDAEKWIEAEYEEYCPGVTDLMRRLGDNMTGDDTLVPTFKDATGIVQYGEEEVVLAVKEMEDYIFANERRKYIEKATERLEKHWVAKRDGEKILIVGGFLHLVYQMEPSMRAVVWSVLAQAKIEVEEMREALKESKWDPELKTNVKVYTFVDGIQWYQETVKPIANRAVMALQTEFGSFGVKSIPQSLRDGIENAVSIMMRGEILPMKGKDRLAAIDAIEEKAGKIKFYGGTAVGQLWRAFSAWQMIKRLADKEESGSGHVDDVSGSDVQAKKEAQYDAEAKEAKGWEPKFPREPRSK